MKFKIVGMGPGNPDYVLPAARKALDNAQMIIGGKRHLEPFADSGKHLVGVEGQLTKLPEIIRTHMEELPIVVAVSGDTGFFSLLSYLKKHFDADQFDVIPGISSLQYMYSQVGMVYQNSYIGSVHGRALDFSSLVLKYESVGLLTDQTNTPAAIAANLLEAGIDDVKIYVGENLSYEDERITCYKPEVLGKKEFSDLVVVILKKE